MSEYLEALSRLNAPERTPGVYIPRSLFMMPRRDTPYHKNRIMAETLNSPLPKYSIPQVFFLPEQDDDTYEFELDKQFTLAKGGRKSIAVRSIHLSLDYDAFQYYTSTKEYKIDVLIEGEFSYRPTNLVGDTRRLIFTHKYSIQSALDEIRTDLIDYLDGNEFKQAINNIFPARDLVFADVAADDYTRLIRITSPTKDILVGKFTCTISSGDIDLSGFLLSQSIKIEAEPGKPSVMRIDCSKVRPITTDRIFVCSSLNPWSPKNIIGTLSEDFSVLNRLFPYDNQQTFKIWFLNDCGGRFPNYKFFTGHIELELIIDNENNFAIDE